MAIGEKELSLKADGFFFNLQNIKQLSKFRIINFVTRMPLFVTFKKLRGFSNSPKYCFLMTKPSTGLAHKALNLIKSLSEGRLSMYLPCGETTLTIIMGAIE